MGVLTSALQSASFFYKKRVPNIWYKQNLMVCVITQAMTISIIVSYLVWDMIKVNNA